ncbi:aminotransferase class III-fold pyridoxal phosphate-dependent enzyme, partial [Chloroflexi bacterium TSY]|nr:aminotransferase class III-fold pyridoxal phosphate-dependent enzyme [Chloroflexi bacterium TSY]
METSANTVSGAQTSTQERILSALKQARTKLEVITRQQNEPIAIIGMACRLPGGANDPESFWQLLDHGVDAVTEVPSTRWPIDTFYDSVPGTPGKMNTRWSGFLEEVDQFDARFFGISSREAIHIDPQQRLLMEICWEALEHAALAPYTLSGSRTGVFVGICSNDYARLQVNSPTSTNAYSGTSNAKGIAANRLSYLLDFRGPSIAVDTACSSSLVAVHQACQSLRQQECDLALSGGVNLILSPDVTIAFSQAGMMASDGRCKTFDTRADGYVRGEGAGMVVLKRLSDALCDDDPILALIRGSAVNQDGRSNGLTAPNGPAQRAVILEVLKNAQVEPSQIGYVEAHGTGTALGDPIEVNALKQIINQGTTHQEQAACEPCWIGSVKTNIGHLESAAGIASLIKVVLSLQAGKIPPHLHFSELNLRISLADSPLAIPTQGQPWPAERRMAGISSFGFGGTNAHIILGEAPKGAETSESVEVLQVANDSEFAETSSEMERPLHLLTLSAKDHNALCQLAKKYATRLRAKSDGTLADICFTANTGRTHFSHRLAAVDSTTEQLAEQLASFTAGEKTVNLIPGQNRASERPSVIFLFTGQGSQYVDMGRELYETQPTFRQTLDRCNEILEPYLDHSLLFVMFSSDQTAEDHPTTLSQTAYSQPALEYALAQLWLSWEIVPAAVLGHSVGEYVAACIAGAFSLEDGLKLIATRGRLMQTLPSDGAMAAVFANKAEVNAAIQPYVHDVTIAAINGPRNIVISGRRQAMPDIVADLTAKGIESRALRVSHAFHSPLMEPMLDAFEETAHTVSMHPLRIPLVSNLIGKMLPVGEQLDAKYWRQHIREPVRFATGIQTLLTQEQASIFLEIGPKPILSGLGKQSETEKTATWLPSLKQGKDDWEMMLRSLGTLYVQGVNIDWKAFDQEYKRRRLALPTYPFQRKRYWIFDESTSMNMTEQTSVSAGSVQAEEAASSLHREQILSSLRSLVAELLHESASDVNIHTPFIEMGADSIVMLDAIRRVESTYSVKIAIRQLFEDISTIDALATYVAEATEPESTMAQAVQIDAHTSAAINDIQHAVKHASSIQRATQTPSHLPASFQESIDPSEHVPQIEFGERATSDPMIERVIMRQIDFMAHQLDLLRGNGSATAKHADPNDKRSENGAVKNGHPGEGVAPNSASPILNGDIKDSATGIAQVSTGKQPTENGRAPQQEKQSSAAPVLPFAPTQAAEMWAKGLTSHQQQHLSTLIERYTKRTAKSKAMTQQYRPVLADNRASAGFRFSIKEMLYPIIGERSQDGRVWDVDGNEYVDLSMGFGVNLFGHQPDFVRQAIDAQLQKGLQLGVQSDLAGQVATLVSELTGMDRITFLNSGTEAVMTALRLARTATGRNKIAVFSGAYHGHFDGTSATINPAATEPNGDGPQAVPFAPGITPNMVADVVVIDGYGDPASLDVIRANSDDLAAVLVSPVQSRHPDLQPTEFLHQLRAITREAGIALIFDEMITGFRIHPGGAQAWFGVQADMATYGKIVGGGMPIGAMWHYGDDSYPSAETTFFAGTFCKHPLAMAAAQAVLTHIKSQGPALYEQLNGRTAQFAATLNAYFDQMQVPIHIDHFGPLFRFAFSGNMDLLFYHLLDKGVYIWEGRTCFLSTAHTDADLEHVMQAVKESVQEMQAGGFLPTKEKTEKQSQKHVASQNNLARSQPETTIEAPLSEAQQQLWFLAEIGDDGSMAYNESVCLQLNGELDVAAFRRTIQTLAARHEALRTTISTDGKCQYIHPNLEIELSLIDGSQEDMWQSELTTDQGQEPFDLTVGPLFRAHLIRLAPQRHLLVLMAHHIIVDGWSMGVIVQEMSQLYSAYSQGESIDLYPPMPFRTYVQWLTEQCQTTEMAEHEAYWLGQLSNSTPVLDLPLDHPRPPVKTYAGQRHTIRLDAELTNNIKSLSKSHGCTLFMTLFAAYTTFLHRITGQDDIVVGIPAAGRSMEGSQGLVGYCAHLLPIRTIADEGSPFSDYLTKMRSTLFEASSIKTIHLRLLSRLKFERDASLSPVIATTFNLDRPVDVPKLLGIEADLTALPMSFVDHEISLNITEIDGAFAVDFDYNSDLFETTTIERLARHFESLLAGIVANPEQSISKLPLLTEAEQHQLLVEWNATQVDYPYDCTLQQLFEAQVEQTPNAIAVQFSESQNGQYANGQLPST